MLGWLKRLFGGGKVAPPHRREIRSAEKDRGALQDRRERLLYEAMELDEAIQALYDKYKKADRELLKQEYLRDLTIKRAEYESLNARLERIGEAAVAHTRRSAFLQSFLDLPEVTERDLDRLEELQTRRKEQERRGAIYADRVIELTEMAPESSMEAQRLQRETLEKLEAEEASKNKRAAEAAMQDSVETVDDPSRLIEEALERERQLEAEKRKQAAEAETEFEIEKNN